MSASNWVHIDVELVVWETDSAFLFRVDGEDIWIPRSQVADPENYIQGDENCSVSITEWIAKQKGIEGE